MPWNASKSGRDVREEFIQRLLSDERSLAGLCREFGISRKTAYKWKKRYLSGGSLDNLSRRPKTFPRATSDEVVDEILSLRQKHRSLGGRKIGVILRRRGVQGVPSGTTITSILRSRNLLDKQAVNEARHFVRFRKNRSNEMWQADFKGHFGLGDGSRCHVLNVIDDYSRFCLCCEPLPGETLEAVKPVFVRIFREYGLPFSLLCDNGNPWGKCVNERGLTRFEAWLMELGVLTIHGKPRHPQTQGKEERFNKSFTREAMRDCDLRDLVHAKAGFDEFRAFYNNERPHCALADMCPSELYHPSITPFPECVPEWEYPDAAIVRKVDAIGAINFNARLIFLSGGLSRKRVALVPTGRDGVYNILFRQFLVAKYDFRENAFEFVRTYLLDGDPRPSFPGLG